MLDLKDIISDAKCDVEPKDGYLQLLPKTTLFFIGTAAELLKNLKYKVKRDQQWTLEIYTYPFDKYSALEDGFSMMKTLNEERNDGLLMARVSAFQAT